MQLVSLQNVPFKLHTAERYINYNREGVVTLCRCERLVL